MAKTDAAQKNLEQENLAPETAELLRGIIQKHKGCGESSVKKDAVMAVLTEVQEKHGYLPYEVQRFIAI